VGAAEVCGLDATWSYCWLVVRPAKPALCAFMLPEEMRELSGRSAALNCLLPSQTVRRGRVGTMSVFEDIHADRVRGSLAMFDGRPGVPGSPGRRASGAVVRARYPAGCQRCFACLFATGPGVFPMAQRWSIGI
jgi:hypothetical protein